MNRWRFVLTGRWLRYLLLAVVFAVACAGLSSWQLARREEKVAEIHRIESNYDAEPVPLTEALPRLDAYSADQEWQPVLLTGRYLDDDQLLVRNRPHAGASGYEQLVPFETEDGAVFVVDRGWLPTASLGGPPDEVPDPPSGEVTVVARLKAGEPAVPGGTTSTGVLASIQLAEVSRLVDRELYSAAYGLLASEDPAAADTPLPPTRPEIDEGPHLSYAFQWVVFALIGFAGLGFAVREEFRHRNADDPEEQRRAAKRAARLAAKRSDAAEEDELIESGR